MRIIIDNYLFIILIFQRLAKEEELVAAKNKAEELEKENSTIAVSLAKKEQELDLRNQEKVNKFFILQLIFRLLITCRIYYLL